MLGFFFKLLLIYGFVSCIVLAIGVGKICIISIVHEEIAMLICKH